MPRLTRALLTNKEKTIPGENLVHVPLLMCGHLSVNIFWLSMQF